ncbi:MAG: trypsin-like peptidase domain-containing protein [Xanthomonadales bacterium]|jgi:serine peptidase DegS|nr:trypsin-like peptidase domain-containing protein [Xanthomonadales bacterium]
MTVLNKFLGFLARAIIAGLALAFVIVYLWPAVMKSPQESSQNGFKQQSAPASYADAVNRAAPAVVSIYTRAYVAPAPGSRQSFLNQFKLRAIAGDGSGVILRPDGYIITNHHVIYGVSDINIVLWDGRFLPARVVGSDPATDLAVLKVDLEDLPVALIREDGAVNVGDVVLAIGNALGLSHTVSMGIVSATGRNDLRSLLYQDFIQTDAAINAGNSGGALINTNGELVGINARHLAGTTGAQNIGFAIPVSLARDVMNQIIDYGTVRRGWLGASYSDLRPSAQNDGTAIRIGIGVREVERGGPAWDAGIRDGDYILSLDGEQVSDASRFLLAISQRVPGSKVELVIQRGTERFETYATLIQQPPLQD